MKNLKKVIEGLLFVFVMWYSFNNLEKQNSFGLSFCYLVANMGLIIFQVFRFKKESFLFATLFMFVWGLLFYFYFLNLLSLSYINIIDKISIILLNIFMVIPFVLLLISKLNKESDNPN